MADPTDIYHWHRLDGRITTSGQPTEAQLAALEELIKYLRKRVGRSKGRVLIVKAHREINPKPTDCPGNRFPYSWMHRTF